MDIRFASEEADEGIGGTGGNGKHEQRVLSFFSTLIKWLEEAFKKGLDTSKKLNLSKLRRYLNQELQVSVTEKELEAIFSGILRLEGLFRHYLKDQTLHIKREEGDLKLSISSEIKSYDQSSSVQTNSSDSKRKKVIIISLSDLQKISDLFEIFTIQKFKGFSLAGKNSAQNQNQNQKVLTYVKKLLEKYPLCFTVKDDLAYFSPVCFDLIKTYSKYQKLRRPLSQIKVGEIIFHIRDS
jgi:Na+/phosphate symporter